MHNKLTAVIFFYKNTHIFLFIYIKTNFKLVLKFYPAFSGKNNSFFFSVKKGQFFMLFSGLAPRNWFSKIRVGYVHTYDDLVWFLIRVNRTKGHKKMLVLIELNMNNAERVFLFNSLYTMFFSFFFNHICVADLLVLKCNLCIWRVWFIYIQRFHLSYFNSNQYII